MEYPQYGLVTPLCNGHLGKLIFGPNKIPEYQKVMMKAAKDIAQGFAALHNYGIIHYDMKPENILFVSDSMDNYEFKIADFGVSSTGMSCIKLTSTASLVCSFGALFCGGP